MKNIRREFATWVQVVVFLFVWASILYASGVELRINLEALKKLPEAIAVYTVLQLIFTSWLWRVPFFQGWLVPFPNLQGTWEGTLESTWIDPGTGQPRLAIPVILVVQQSFSSISCAMLSQESSSFSNAAQITAEDETAVLRLSYNYTNRPKAAVRDRSQMHDGAATLRIITAPQLALEGEYWTDRKTTGDIRLTFKSRKLADRFS
jgi:hypothetical protein